MNNFEIKQISNDVALEFLKENHARSEWVFVRSKDVWYGCYVNNTLAGVGGTQDKGTHIELGGLFVKPEFRNQGIATAITKVEIETNKNKKNNKLRKTNQRTHINSQI